MAGQAHGDRGQAFGVGNRQRKHMEEL